MTATEVETTQVEPAGQPPRPSARRSWPVPVGLLALSIIPVMASVARVVQLSGGPALIPADTRFAEFPVPLLLHVVGAAAFLVVGAFQFVPRFRRRHLDWHRRTGRVLAAAGLVVAVSAVWMTLLYTAKPGTGELLYVLRLGFGTAMAACLVLGVSSIRRREVAAHRAWMTRAYALGLAAGTQAFTQGAANAAFGTSTLVTDLGIGAGWVINLAAAEWVIRRQPSVRRSTSS
jgi:uncharacterized membrane protein